MILSATGPPTKANPVREITVSTMGTAATPFKLLSQKYSSTGLEKSNPRQKQEALAHP
jgi:hypothetical protein